MKSTQAASSRHFYIFVRLMRLVDAAGAADHARNAGLLELSGLGGIGHGDGAIGAGEPQRQRLRRRARLRREARNLHLHLASSIPVPGKGAK